MRLSEFDDICQAICPYCKGGEAKLSQRESTKEWVHTQYKGSKFWLVMCLATHFRNSKFAEIDSA